MTINADKRPKRIQRKRSKGWRMPPNTVYVGRPTMWGNPFDHRVYGAERAVKQFRMVVETGHIFDLIYHSHLTPNGDDHWSMDVWLKPLRGMNLACWCPDDQPCHADVLLELANQPTREALNDE